MYHQLQKIGEEGLIAEIEYTIDDPEDGMPVITKITIGETVIPVGAFDLLQIECIADKLLAGHDAVMRGLIDDARIDAYEANNDR
jgi:hypothetical protein